MDSKLSKINILKEVFCKRSNDASKSFKVQSHLKALKKKMKVGGKHSTQTQASMLIKLIIKIKINITFKIHQILACINNIY